MIEFSNIFIISILLSVDMEKPDLAIYTCIIPYTGIYFSSSLSFCQETKGMKIQKGNFLVLFAFKYDLYSMSILPLKEMNLLERTSLFE